MRKFFTISFFKIIIINFSLSQCSSSTLIISAYLEGSSNNKCIEIYNGTGSNVNLSNYNIQVFSNGSSSATNTTTLGPGTMLSGATYVICNPSNNIFTANQTSANINFNGNDAVALRNGTTIVDVIGQIGTNPGTEWGSAPCSTINQTLYRDLSGATCNGDNIGNDAFDPSVWTTGGSCAAQDDVTGLVASPLPVDLIYFILNKNNNYSKINWSTASETNNSHFNIERSADARNFETIGEIKGAGNSSKELSYEFTDERPLPGINYYRIKQTDYDGQYSYSEIRSVRHKGLSNVTVTPRTTEGRLDITTELEDYTIAIYNAAGQEVKRMVGMSLDQSISIETLNAGVYFVKINSGSESETVRIVKI